MCHLAGETVLREELSVWSFPKGMRGHKDFRIKLSLLFASTGVFDMS